MKKAISCLLVLAVLLTFLPAPAAHAMPDTSGRLTEQVGVLQMLGVISGYPDGTYRPDAYLTRAQFCKMAVVLLGKADEIGLYKSYTIYPDVKSSHWAAGYINLSVKSLGLIKGFPDGSFRPETPITYAQAITILMRALGYTDADVGLSWPAGYLSKAASVGLTAGITVSADASITRGSGAALFYNMLGVKTKSGAKFITSISGSVTENAVILDNNAKAPDGSDGAVLLAGSEIAIKALNPVPDAFVGMRGTLALDSAGLVKTFLPGDYTRKSFVLSESVYPKLISSDGEGYTLKSDTPVYLDGKEYKYLNISYDLDPGTYITIAYTTAGAVDYVIAESSASSANTAVLTATPSQGALESMLGASGGGTIYKNGTISTPGDLKKYDVVSYDAGTNTFTVSDFKLSGAYEYAYPNTTAPTRITVLGTEFEVLSSAIPQLAKYKIGDPLTFLFTENRKVAGVVPQSELKALAVGVYNGTGVELPNGIVLSAGQSPVSLDTGTLVNIYSYRGESTEVREIRYTNPGISIDMNAGTAGDAAIAGNTAFYEKKVGSDGALRRIAKRDISPAVLSAANVLYLGYDTAGRVNLIVLDDVTGDSYIYGMVYPMLKEAGEWDNSKFHNRYVYVNNSEGKTAEYPCSFALEEEGEWGGIAIDKDNKVSKYIPLIKYTNLTRQSFTTENGMMLNGLRAEISKDVHIYVNATGKYMTAAAGTTFDQLISDARAFGSSFEAYTDRDPSVGGKVRVIVIK